MTHEKPVVEVREVADAHRIEAYVEGRLAGIVEYIPARRLVAFVHTEVDPEFEGRGVGSALARAGLEMVRRDDARFLAVCPFIAGWSVRHPEFEPWRYHPVSQVTD